LWIKQKLCTLHISKGFSSQLTLKITQIKNEEELIWCCVTIFGLFYLQRSLTFASLNRSFFNNSLIYSELQEFIRTFHKSSRSLRNLLSALIEIWDFKFLIITSQNPWRQCLLSFAIRYFLIFVFFYFASLTLLVAQVSFQTLKVLLLLLVNKKLFFSENEVIQILF
jgi:hypothetical protein